MRRHSGISILLGAVLGLSVASGPLLQFTFGVFLNPVSEAFKADRGLLSAALFAGLACNGLAVPFFGWLVDRYGIAKVTYPAIILSGLLTAALGFIPQSAMGFIICYGLLGVAFGGQTPLPYARAVTAAFTRRRGLALGIAMSGVGIGTALLPQLAQQLISMWDWRQAYVALGAIVICVGLPAVKLITSDVQKHAVRTPEQGSLTLSGMSAREAVRRPAFWLMAGAFFWVTMAASGMAAHFVPLLTDAGITASVAAKSIGVMGLSLIGGRIVAGWLLDRYFAPHVAMIFFGLMVGAALILISTSALPLLLLAAAFLGLGLGGEVDIIAYFISRYFGLGAFGQIYGYLFTTFMFGGALGPLIMGLSHARSGSYDIALWCFVGVLALSILLLSRLGQYRF